MHSTLIKLFDNRFLTLQTGHRIKNRLPVFRLPFNIPRSHIGWGRTHGPALRAAATNGVNVGVEYAARCSRGGKCGSGVVWKAASV